MRHPGGVVLIVGAVLGSAGALGFNRLVTTRIDEASASDLRAVLGGLSAVGFLSLGVQLAVVGVLGGANDESPTATFQFKRPLIAAAVTVALGTGAVCVAAIESSTAFRLRSGFFVAVAVGAILLSCKPRAELLLRESWPRLAILFVAAPLVRLVVGLWLLAQANPELLLVPIVTGEALSCALAFALQPRRSTPGTTVPARNIIVGGLASTGLLAFFALSSVGLRAQLGSDAEVFNTAATVARTVWFLPLAVSMVYFPRLARRPVGTAALRQAFLAATLWTLGMSSLAAMCVIAWPAGLVEFATRTEEPSLSVVRLLALSAAIGSAALVSLFVYIAHGSRFALAAWPVAATMGFAQLVSTSAEQLAVWVLASSLLLAVAVVVPAFLRVQPLLHPYVATYPHPAHAGDLALVIPCYNPGPAVVHTITQSAALLKRISSQPSIIAVSDGSTDGSDELIDQIGLPMVQHIRHSHNRGKGAALRTGFRAANSEYVAFIDADGDIAPEQLEVLLSAQQDFAADIVFGSKLHPGSVVHASLLRRTYSFGYRRLIRLMFQLDIEDTQTGIKMFRREVLDAVTPSLREEKYALDLELFVAARAAGFDNFVAVPVTLRRESGSTISLSSVVKMFGDTLRLFWRSKVTLAYAKSTTRPATATTGSIAVHSTPFPEHPEPIQ